MRGASPSVSSLSEIQASSEVVHPRRGSNPARTKPWEEAIHGAPRFSPHLPIRPTFDLPLLPSHKAHSIGRNFDPSVHLLLFQQIKNWLFEQDRLVRFREIQKKAEFLLVIGS
jgi:hypothetical protein